jgi:hypothetical protein
MAECSAMMSLGKRHQLASSVKDFSLKPDAHFFICQALTCLTG